MNDPVLLLLRIVHIGAAVFWVGSVWLTFFFLLPTVRATGPAGAQFMQHMGLQRRVGLFIFLANVLTIVAGALLYWRDSQGLNAAWITSPTGIGFTIGALAGIAAFIIGGVMIRPLFDRMGQLGAQIAAAGGPPPAELLAEVRETDGRLNRLLIVDLVLVTAALVFMAIARYLG